MKATASISKRDEYLQDLGGVMKKEGFELTDDNVEDQLKLRVERELKQLSDLEPSEKKRKRDDIVNMISYYGKMTDEIETRRNKTYDWTLQYIVLLITFTGIFLTVWGSDLSTKKWLWLPIIFLITQLLFSVFLIVVYELQTSYRYPFLKLKRYSNKWKWFYYGNPAILRITTDPIAPTNTPSTTTIPYLEGLETFVNKYRTETVDDELSDDLQQLYLLQVHNYYKNRFYLALLKIRKVSLIVTLISLLLGAIVIYNGAL